MSDQWQVATGAAAGTKICVRDVPKISNLPFVRAPYTLRKAQKMLAACTNGKFDVFWCAADHFFVFLGVN